MDQPRGDDRLSEVPARLVILGGGPVGVELAQAWRIARPARSRSSRARDRLLPREEAFAGEQRAAALRERGVEVRTGARGPHGARARTAARCAVTLADGSERHGRRAARGRGPAAADRGHRAGGRRARGRRAGAEVDDHLRVPGHDWLYAIGDVQRPRAADPHGQVPGARRRRPRPRPRPAPCSRTTAPLSPRVVFTEPQVAAVGHTLDGAQEAGLT